MTTRPTTPDLLLDQDAQMARSRQMLGATFSALSASLARPDATSEPGPLGLNDVLGALIGEVEMELILHDGTADRAAEDVLSEILLLIGEEVEGVKGLLAVKLPG